ncbi:MAG TPA: DUF4058 family protein [Caldilineae bacterium]|nr:DUF4058 family protein [Caldilineae bacterium]
MPTPFPGMAPCLERSGFGEEVHTALLIEVQQHLTPKVRPTYRVAVERRTYLTVAEPNGTISSGKPDVLVIEAHGNGGPTRVTSPAAVLAPPLVADLPMPEEVVERYLAVREVASNKVITVIEILSPSNKLPGVGRDQYERKRLQVLGSQTNLVEIDLLRAGEPLPMWVRGGDASSDYRIVVSRAQHRPRADVYLFSVRQPIPNIPIPLRPGESEPVLPLNQILHELYDRAGYDLAIDYSQPPEPPLRKQDVAWAETLLAGRK